MNTIDTTKLRFRSTCCGAPLKEVPKVGNLTQWHELRDNGESNLMCYGVCSKCDKLSEFRQIK